MQKHSLSLKEMNELETKVIKSLPPEILKLWQDKY